MRDPTSPPSHLQGSGGGGGGGREEGDKEDRTPVGFPDTEIDDSLTSFNMSEQAGFDLYERNEDSPASQAEIDKMELDIEELSNGSSRATSPIHTPSSSQPVESSMGDAIGVAPREETGRPTVPASLEEDSDVDVGLMEEDEGGIQACRVDTSVGRSNRDVGPSNSSAVLGVSGVKPRGTAAAALSSDPNALYCMCRQPALNYFMIQCHKCEEWFHGSCVGITRQKSARVKDFYCPLCIDRDPSLVTVFLSKAEEEEAALREKQRSQIYNPGPSRKTASRSGKKHNRRCGECVACLTETDCRKCRFCKDMPKYGGPGRMRQKCIKRQCLKLSKILYAEDPLYSKSKVLQQDIYAELRAVGGDVVEQFKGKDPTTISSSSSYVPSSSTDVTKLDADSSVRFTMMSDQPLGAGLVRLPPTSQKAKPQAKRKPGKRLGGGGQRQSQQGGRRRGGGRGRKTRTRLSTSDFDDFTQVSPGWQAQVCV